jgi:hypothetical protein
MLLKGINLPREPQKNTKPRVEFVTNKLKKKFINRTLIMKQSTNQPSIKKNIYQNSCNVTPHIMSSKRSVIYLHNTPNKEKRNENNYRVLVQPSQQ